MTLPKRPEFVALEQLHLDPQNPRLPFELRGSEEAKLYPYIARHYDAITIAESIARFSYFPSEPLVTLRDENGALRVIEGNRRLTALKGLTDPAVRATFRLRSRWERAAARAESNLPAKYPVLIAETWEDAAPLIGFRHISGIEEWDTFQKAEFIARLVDAEKRDFEEIAELVGEPLASVRTYYRNFSIVEQAKTRFELPVAANAEQLFGTFTAVLNRRALREFIGADQPAQVQPRQWPLPDSRKDDVAELLSWIYGDGENEPVIDETRDLGDLARIVESREGLAELKASRSLDAADTASGGPGERLKKTLSSAANALESAQRSTEIAGDDDDLDDLVLRCVAATRALNEARGLPPLQ